ncbi:unnamed protein product [Brachionus calyciflorus]|uniref:EF-hand domain-containing protein n=1 Tax=Brachionus calyciflorus TaxID=104777 RepID=A0A813N596_9BILA|nr:unnamed protein product [Brachionus calyciflorus]
MHDVLINKDEKLETLNNNNNVSISINKVPSIKKAVLVSRPKLKDTQSKSKYTSEKSNNSSQNERVWQETKTYFLPLMPSETDEKDAYLEKEYRCCYCDQLSDDQCLECKVCSKVAHIDCLYKRGHLNTLSVSKKLEWNCSDCCDLSKCLQDHEMRKIINLFDELDFKKNCYVTFGDYMNVKQKLYEKDGEVMSVDKYQEEERRFRLIDKDSSGSITWNEFCEFEAANLLAKKNKIELSNHLTIKELIKAKRMFSTYDKEKLNMINKEDSKKCYIEYIQKLRFKLGPIFSEHISNCIDLFGLNPQGEQKTNSAKTIWPEFIRKMTILLLYDRLNYPEFTPKYWKPGFWYSMETNRSYQSDEISIDSSLFPFIDPSHSAKKNEVNIVKTNHSQYGSHEFVIRSNRTKNSSSLSINDVLVESEDEFDIYENSEFKPIKKSRLPNRAKLNKFQHDSFNKKTNRLFKNLSNEKLRDYSDFSLGTSNKMNFHLPSLVNSSSQNFESTSQNYFAPNYKNKSYLKSLTELDQAKHKGHNGGLYQVDLKHQNQLNFFSKSVEQIIYRAALYLHLTDGSKVNCFISEEEHSKHKLKEEESTNKKDAPIYAKIVELLGIKPDGII